MDFDDLPTHGGPDSWPDGWHDPVPRAEHASIVLGAARRELERGWTQDRWHAVADRPRGWPDTAGWTRDDRDAIDGSCLVGAVLRAAWWYGDRAEYSAPAVDALWNELQLRRGLGPVEPIERVCSPAARPQRVRDLTRWNDRPERTAEDVLALLDAAVARLAAGRA